MGYPIQGSKSSLFAEMDFFLVCTYVGFVCLGSVLIIYLSDLSSCRVCKPLCLHYLQYITPTTHPLSPSPHPHLFLSSLPPPPPFFILHANALTPFSFPPSLFLSVSMVLWCIHDKGSYLSMIVASGSL